MASEEVSYEATLAYADGLEHYDNGNKSEALNNFNKAVELAPNFDRARSMIEKLRTS